MDVATIVLTASSIIIILQVVSIVLIIKNKKSAALPLAVPSAAQPVQTSYDQRDFRKRRDENRFSRRPPMEQRPKPAAPQPPQAVDYVEKSLRDINLKLKNAERDQENARKKIRDVIQQPSQNQNQNSQRRPEYNQNRPNRGRDDDFRRRDGRDRQRPNNNQFRDRDRERDRDQNRPPEMERPIGEHASPISPSINAPVSTPIPIRDAVQPQASMPAPVQPVQPVVEKEVISVAPENTEIFHGRKVLVRRRILTPEEQAAKDQATAAPVTPAPENVSVGAVAPQNHSIESEPAAPETRQSSGNEGEAEPIRFGR